MAKKTEPKTAKDYKRSQRERDEAMGMERFEFKMPKGTKASMMRAVERAELSGLDELISLLALNLDKVDRSVFERMTSFPRHELNLDHIDLSKAR